MSNDQNDPSQIFTPFTPAPAPEVAKPERQKRRRANKVADPRPAPARKQRRRRVAKTVTEVRVPTALTINMPLGLVSALAGIKDEDKALFEKLVGILNAAGQGQRQRVLQALVKVFA